MIIRSKEQWMDLFKQHEASGLTMAEFCRRNDLSKKYFSLRRKQLGFKATEQKPVKKRVKSDFIKVSVKNSTESTMTLELGELKLNFNELPPTNWLADLVKTL